VRARGPVQPSASHEVRSALGAVRELAAESEDGAFSPSKLYFAAAPQEFGDYVHPALAVTDVPGVQILLRFTTCAYMRGCMCVCARVRGIAFTVLQTI
jgi:hypothetical protein